MVQAQVISAWLARTCASIYDVSAHPDLGSMAIEHLPERFDTPNQHSRPESVPNAWDTQPKSPIYHLPSSYDTSQLLEEDLGNHDDILAHFHNSPTDFGFNNFGTGSQYHDPPHDQIESPSFWNEFINSQMHSDLTNFGPSFEAPVTHSTGFQRYHSIIDSFDSTFTKLMDTHLQGVFTSNKADRVLENHEHSSLTEFANEGAHSSDHGSQGSNADHAPSPTPALQQPVVANSLSEFTPDDLDLLEKIRKKRLPLDLNPTEKSILNFNRATLIQSCIDVLQKTYTQPDPPHVIHMPSTIQGFPLRITTVLRVDDGAKIWISPLLPADLVSGGKEILQERLENLTKMMCSVLKRYLSFLKKNDYSIFEKDEFADLKQHKSAFLKKNEYVTRANNDLVRWLERQILTPKVGCALFSSLPPDLAWEKIQFGHLQGAILSYLTANQDEHIEKTLTYTAIYLIGHYLDDKNYADLWEEIKRVGSLVTTAAESRNIVTENPFKRTILLSLLYSTITEVLYVKPERRRFRKDLYRQSSNKKPKFA